MSYQPKRIDVHHHLVPPKFMAWLNENHPEWTGGPDIPHDARMRAGPVCAAHPIQAFADPEFPCFRRRLSSCLLSAGGQGHEVA